MTASGGRPRGRDTRLSNYEKAAEIITGGPGTRAEQLACAQVRALLAVADAIYDFTREYARVSRRRPPPPSGRFTDGSEVF